MINKYDAEEIATHVANNFRTRVSHLRADITGEDYENVRDLCKKILEKQIDNSQILDRQLNPASGEVENASK